MRIDGGNVQATVIRRPRRPISRHLLLRFGDRDGARAFLRELTPGVATADLDLDSIPDPMLNLGLTFNGLVALGVDSALLDELDSVYRTGPEPGPLGDAVGSRSDPAGWWEGRFRSADVHVVAHLYVRDDAALEPATAALRAVAGHCGVTELCPRADGTVLDGRSLGGGTLHFGYTDGISQPDVRWDDGPLAAGEVTFRRFLLGYATAEHSSAPQDGPAAALVRDSTYAVFRWIYQDSAAFNRFLAAEGPRLFPQLPPADAEELLAAKLMGRWRDGTPLVLSADRPDDALAKRNDFGYAHDAQGHRCPFSAHIRVVNPRDQPLDPIVDEVPPVIRRGMPYGPVLDSTEDDGLDRGILGIFLCADIRRQVYTLTSWIARNDFSPVYDANRRVQDPVVGNRGLPGTVASFRVPSADGDRVLTGLPDFVHTKGTVFLLMPSRSMLQALAG